MSSASATVEGSGSQEGLGPGRRIPESPVLRRYRATFAILEPMRFTGHLDLLRAWERTMRRAGLPLAYTRGYHAHPRIQIGAALPLGCTASSELLDLWLEQDLLEHEVGAALEQRLPPGLGLRRLTALPTPYRDLQDEILAGDYTVIPLESDLPSQTAQAVGTFLASSSMVRQRRGRAYDLRPLVLDLRFLQSQPCGSLSMRLRLGQAATGRPDEVLACLGLEELTVHVCRDRLLLRGIAGDLAGSDR